jgi:hypothetical protein
VADSSEAPAESQRAWIVPLVSALLTGVVALWVAAEHGRWIAGGTAPIVFSDSAIHALRTVQARDTFDPWSPVQSLGGGYYPPGAALLSVVVFHWNGMTMESIRLTQVVFTALGCLGAGGVAWRAAGPWFAPAAAALWLTFPLAWTQLRDVQLDWPLACSFACALACLPPLSVARVPRVRTFLGGLVFGAALLSKQTMVGPGGALVLLLAGRFLWRLRAGPRREAWVAGAEFALWCVGALVVAGGWYWRSWRVLAEVLASLPALHPLPTGTDPLAWKLSLLAFAKFLAFHQALGPFLAVGLFLLPWLLRRRPYLLFVAGAGAALLAVLLNFADPHERHFVALAPVVIALALAPFGRLPARGGWRWLSGASAAAFVVAGGVYTSSWRTTILPSDWPHLQLGGLNFAPHAQHDDWGRLGRQLVAPFNIRGERAPLPWPESWPLDAAATLLIAQLPPAPPRQSAPFAPVDLRAMRRVPRRCGPLLTVDLPGFGEQAMQLALILQGEERVRIRENACAGGDAREFRVKSTGQAGRPGGSSLGAWPITQGEQTVGWLSLEEVENPSGAHAGPPPSAPPMAPRGPGSP